MTVSFEIAAKRLQAYKDNVMVIVGNEIVNFALDNFDKQGFQDGSLKPWPERSSGNDGRAILVGKQGGRGRRSIRVTRRTKSAVKVGSNLEYMGLHNEGGTIKVTVTPRSRRYFWAMYYETGNEMWKAMALTKKKQLTITMPERRFIGDSKTLDKRIKKVLELQLEKVFK